MEEKTIRSIYARAKYVAGKYGCSHEAEDIAQAVLLAFIKNPASKQTVEQAVIDYLRQTGNRTRGGARRICLYDRESTVSEADVQLPSEPTGADGELLSRFERYLKHVKEMDRCIIVLTYVWGLNQKEIGYCFGVTESRICQRLKGIQGRLSRFVAKEEYGQMQSVRPRINAKAKGRSLYENPFARTMESVQGQEISARPHMASASRSDLAQEKSKALAIAHEARFDEWLT